MNNEMTEWSLPWHELQRSLAAGFAAHAATDCQSNTWRTDVRCAPVSALSWLVRARTRALPVSPPIAT
jgi:hypothetical protein